MILQGNNLLTLATQSGISFELDISISNLSGDCNLGFSGWTQQSLNFNFNKGNIFDPNDRLVYYYQDNENIKISGNIDTGLYSYYINNYPICLNGNTNLTTGINSFYINTNNCVADLNINVYGKRPDYSFKTSNFYIDPNSFIRADINNSGNLPFVIYSGVIVLPTGFFVDELTSFINQTGTLRINHINQTLGQLEDEKVYEIELDLYTNFGKITRIFSSTGSYSGFFDLNLDFSNSISFTNDTIVGSKKTGDISFYIQLSSGNLRTSPTQFPKYVNIDLEYFGGETGKILFNLPVEGYKNLNINSFLSGSGYINNLIDFTGSGFHEVSGVNVSGYTSGYISDIFILTGFTNKNFNIISTGYYFNQQFILNKDYSLTRFTIDGTVNYNSHVFKNEYNWIYSVTGNNSVTFGEVIKSNSGNIVLISDPNKPNINSTGSVYIFTGNGITWNVYHVYSGLSGDRNFGKNIAINNTGNIICISTDYGNLITDGTIQSYSGRTYIITGIGQSLNTCKTFSGKGYFGNSIGIDEGKTIAIGAYYDNSGLGSINVYKNENIIRYISGLVISTGVNFGTNININSDGNVIIVGGIAVNNNSGQVWIFTGNPNDTWSRLFSFSGESNNEQLGSAVAVNENKNLALAGAPLYGSNSGIVRVYTGDNQIWSKAIDLTGDSTGNYFGISIGINSTGNIVAVGGWNHNSGKGAVWIYTGNNAKNLTYAQKLTGDFESIRFGQSLKMNSSGNMIIIGGPAASSGAAWLYTGFAGNDFALARKFTGDIGSRDFGYAVSINDRSNMILISDSRESSIAYQGTGVVWVYTGQNNNWNYVTQLTPTGGRFSFGYDITSNYSGDIIAISAIAYNNNRGSIWIYTGKNFDWKLNHIITGEVPSSFSLASSIRITSSGNKIFASSENTSKLFIYNYTNILGWENKAYITGNQYITGHRFGYSLDINNQGNLILAGAPTLSNTGYAYIITGENNYSIMQSLRETGINSYNLFGNSVSLSKFGNIGAVGSPKINNDQGKVFIYSGNTFQNDWIINAIITGINNQTFFGNFIKLNDTGNSLFVSAPSENTGAGTVYSYTGNLESKVWPNEFAYKINKNNINNAPLYAAEQFGRVLDFKKINDKDILYVGCALFNTVQVLSLIPFSGYIGSYIPSGIININNNFLITGSLTGLEYRKTFLDTFNILTGYYDSNGFITGIRDFYLNNYISGSKYSKRSLLPTGTNNFYIQITTKNFYDNYKMTGLLTVSGSSISGDKQSVIYTYITGEK